jgi:C1A family cysteine protease
MPPVYDQGELGSCTANAIAAILEHQEMRESEGAITPSRLFIYYGERAIEGTIKEDSGAQIRDGIKVVAGEGAPPEKWGGVTMDGIVGDQTWDVSLHAMMADLETEVGLQYVTG